MLAYFEIAFYLSLIPLFCVLAMSQVLAVSWNSALLRKAIIFSGGTAAAASALLFAFYIFCRMQSGRDSDWNLGALTTLILSPAAIFFCAVTAFFLVYRKALSRAERQKPDPRRKKIVRRTQAIACLVLLCGGGFAARCFQLRADLAFATEVSESDLERLSANYVVMHHRDLRTLLLQRESLPPAVYENVMKSDDSELLEMIALSRFTPREIITRLEQSKYPSVREHAANWIRDRERE